MQEKAETNYDFSPLEQRGYPSALRWWVLIVFGAWAILSLVLLVVGFLGIRGWIASVIVACMLYAAFLIGDKIQLEHQPQRLLEFAKKNNLTYLTFLLSNRSAYFEWLPQPLNGLIFGYGDHRTHHNVLVGPWWATWNYHFAYGGPSKIKASHASYHVAAFRLDRQLPHVFFDSTSDQGLIGEGAAFKGAQKINLEGDFHKHFSVYIPDTYQIDVLSFVAPDLMLLMKERFSGCNIEIIDNVVWIYTKGQANLITALPKMIPALAEFKHALEDNSRRYKDDRLPRHLAYAGLVAGGGLRLQLRRGRKN